MSKLLNIVPYVQLVVWAIIVAVIAIAVIVFLIKKFIGKAKNAKSVGDIITAGKEVLDEIDGVIDGTLLRIKEYARKCIYEKEALFKETTITGKTGAFKYDSVLKEVELECMRSNFEYNSEYWKEYIQDEVNKMKGVK